MSGGSPAAESTADGYPVGPLLERTPGSADGPIEVGVSMSGTESIDENELDVFLVQSAVDPGGQIELGIFVSGVGDLDANDLSVFYDDEAILDLEDPGVVRRSAASRSSAADGESREEGAAGGQPVSESNGGSRPGSDARPGAAPESTSMAGTGTRHPNESHHGSERDAGGATAGQPTDHVQSTSFRSDGSRRGDRLRRLPLEGSADTGPAYILELNTDASAPTGEFQLPVVFTYRSESGIRQVTKIPTVRIRSVRERLQPWLVRLGALGVAFAGIAAVAHWIGVGL